MSKPFTEWMDELKANASDTVPGIQKWMEMLEQAGAGFDIEDFRKIVKEELEPLVQGMLVFRGEVLALLEEIKNK